MMGGRSVSGDHRPVRESELPVKIGSEEEKSDVVERADHVAATAQRGGRAAGNVRLQASSVQVFKAPSPC
jgi:hypothetical protein